MLNLTQKKMTAAVAGTRTQISQLPARTGTGRFLIFLLIYHSIIRANKTSNGFYNL